jgi:hypothetical protein
LPRKKFNKEQADKLWKNYTNNLIDSINDSEKEGLEKGFSSYEIEVLWQTKIRDRTSKQNPEKTEDEKDNEKSS